MKRCLILGSLIIALIPCASIAQITTGEYYLLFNSDISEDEARHIAIKITSDSSYQFLDGNRKEFKIIQSESKIIFPMSNDVCNYSASNGRIDIKCPENNYTGIELDSESKYECETFKHQLIFIDLPKYQQNDSASIEMNAEFSPFNSITLYLSPHRKRLNKEYDKNRHCYVQLDDCVTTVCEIDNNCRNSEIIYTDRNRDLYFKNNLKDYQLESELKIRCYIDKDVKVQDINRTLRAIRKIENLAEVYISVQKPMQNRLITDCMVLQYKLDLNEDYILFKDWLLASELKRYQRTERLMIVDDEVEFE